MTMKVSKKCPSVEKNRFAVFIFLVEFQASKAIELHILGQSPIYYDSGNLQKR